MFWGFLLTGLDFRIIGIDILADPIGYFLVVAGISSLIHEFPIGKRARGIAIVLSVLSIPTVVASLDKVSEMYQIVSYWSIYSIVYPIMQLMLMFFVFQLLVNIAKKHGGTNLQSWTDKLFKIYLVLNLVILIAQPFAINLYGNSLQVIIVGSWVLLFILEIVFLVLLLQFRKLDKS